MESLKQFQKLSRTDLKNIKGGTRIPPAGCACFCYTNNVKSSHSCTSFCPDGSIPGIDSLPPGGTAADCGVPHPLN
jgi:natural product precursor